MQAVDCLGDLPQGGRVLCLGAHSDDIEIGCGGLILTLLANRPDARCEWVVFSATPERVREARRSAGLFLGRGRQHRITVHDFRDGHFPYQGARIKAVFERLKGTAPDLVLTHYRDDRHQDHRVLSDLAWNTFRDHLVLEYEIPKYDGDLGTPNLFVPLTREVVDRKVAHLMAAFGTQRDKHWFSPETFEGLMRLRGMECRSPTGYAEAFYGRKVVLRLGTSPARPPARSR
jgi:LmbE family N-acetylglucosaminyl deacetylase